MNRLTNTKLFFHHKIKYQNNLQEMKRFYVYVERERQGEKF